MYMLEQARERGVRLLTGEVVDVDLKGGAVSGVRLKTPDGEVTIATTKFVNAAGPGLKKIGAILDVDLPIQHELHMKVALEDSKEVIPRHMPLLIWLDPVTLSWSAEEQAILAEDESTRWLLEEFPEGVLGRPEGEGGESDGVDAVAL